MPLSRSAKKTLVLLADLVARVRTPVSRNGYTREVDDLPNAEGPPRLVKQFHQLCKGLCALRGLREPDANVLAILCRVARDTMPPIRERILRVLFTRGRATQTSLSITADLPWATISRELEECKLAHLVLCDEKQWRLTRSVREMMVAVSLFSEERGRKAAKPSAERPGGESPS